MTATLIDGKLVAKEVRSEVKRRAEILRAKGVTPGLAAVLVGDDPASQIYVNSKAKMCQKLGLYSEVITRPAGITQKELIELVRGLNSSDKIHGILVQSPLPKHIDDLAVTLEIRPEKDVDGFQLEQAASYDKARRMVDRAIHACCVVFFAGVLPGIASSKGGDRPARRSLCHCAQNRRERAAHSHERAGLIKRLSRTGGPDPSVRAAIQCPRPGGQ